MIVIVAVTFVVINNILYVTILSDGTSASGMTMSITYNSRSSNDDVTMTTMTTMLIPRYSYSLNT